MGGFRLGWMGWVGGVGLRGYMGVGVGDMYLYLVFQVVQRPRDPIFHVGEGHVLRRV